MVSARKPYGLASDFLKNPSKYGFPNTLSDKPQEAGSAAGATGKGKEYGGLTIHGLLGGKRVCKYAAADYPITKDTSTIDKYKIFIPNAYGCGAIGETIPTPILATPREICTETHLRIGPFNTRREAENALSYLQTKFFRLLVGIKKTTQHSSKDTYSLVPMLDFSESWSDEKLYAKYGLNAEEIAFIEKMIKPMSEPASETRRQRDNAPMSDSVIADAQQGQTRRQRDNAPMSDSVIADGAQRQTRRQKDNAPMGDSGNSGKAEKESA